MNNSTADLILYNANVLTLNHSYPRAQFVAVRGDRVLGVGRNEVLGEFKGARTIAIDCQDKTVLPGFNDAHCHFIALARSFVTSNLDPASIHSILDIQKELGKLSKNLPLGTWVRAAGYNEFYLAEKCHPTRWDIDKVLSAHPVKLTHRSGHAHVLNSLALALVGISRETPDPPGGIIERDLETGEPTGLLYDMDSFLAERVPPLEQDRLEQGVRLASQELLSLGITSIQDCSQQNDFQSWRMFNKWKNEGILKCRVSLMLGMKGFSQLINYNSVPESFASCYPELAKQPDDIAMGKLSWGEETVGDSSSVGHRMTTDSKLRLGGVKIVLQETTGKLSPTQSELEQMVQHIHQSKLQVALHAVEETTIESACSALERVLQKSPRVDHRHRIEHCSVCQPDIAKRLASLGVVVVTQPAFIYYNGDRYLRTVPHRQFQHLYPIATFKKAGVKIAASSDCPGVPANPLIGIYAAVSRKAATGEAVLPDERISTLEALRMYTEDAAYISFEEAIKGSIMPGRFADMVVLNADPTRLPIDEIRNIEVEMTIIGGDIVYKSAI